MTAPASLYIPGNVPSSKNSKQWTGYALIDSVTTRRYKREHVFEYTMMKKSFQKLFEGERKPLKVGLYFVRDSRRRFDYINVCQVIADLMVKYEWIEDDSAEYFIPIFLGYHVDKKKAGVIIIKRVEAK